MLSNSPMHPHFLHFHEFFSTMPIWKTARQERQRSLLFPCGMPLQSRQQERSERMMPIWASMIAQSSGSESIPAKARRMKTIPQARRESPTPRMISSLSHWKNQRASLLCKGCITPRYLFIPVPLEWQSSAALCQQPRQSAAPRTSVPLSHARAACIANRKEIYK